MIEKMDNINYREAVIADVPQIQVVRNAVKENVLSNPALITNDAVVDFIKNRGKGWVAEKNGIVIGFAIVDVLENNIWALFILPEQENKGIGKTLHKLMMHWYFTQTKKTVWLSTEANTRARQFYSLQGWQQVGLYGKNEIKFEMNEADFKNKNIITKN